MARASPDIRQELAKLSGGLAWLLPVAFLVALGISGVAAYFIYKAVTYRDEAAYAEVDQGKEGIPSVDLNRESIHMPVVWEVQLGELPPGAEVYVEGTLHPERPLILQGHESPYLIRVEAEGYVSWEQKVQVHSDLVLSVPMLTYEEAAELAAKMAKKRAKGGASPTGTASAGPATVDFESGDDPGIGAEPTKKAGKGKLKKKYSAPDYKNLEKLL
jgi:hypothetical protein